MTNVAEYKMHIRNILDAIEIGKYKKDSFRTDVVIPNTKIVHTHNITYNYIGMDLYPDYSYGSIGLNNNQETRFDVNAFGKSVPQKSLLIFTDKKGMVFRLHPCTMDDITVCIRSTDNLEDRISLKDFLTPEQYFMYNTLYDLPAYEDIRELMVMGHQLRPELMRKKYKISGLLSTEFVDMESAQFLYEVTRG